MTLPSGREGRETASHDANHRGGLDPRGEAQELQPHREPRMGALGMELVHRRQRGGSVRRGTRQQGFRGGSDDFPQQVALRVRDVRRAGVVRSSPH